MQDHYANSFPTEPPWSSEICELSNWWLEIECSCRQGSSAYPLRLMAANVGWKVTLRSVTKRLKCKHCSSRPTKILLIDDPRGDTGRYGAKSAKLTLR